MCSSPFLRLCLCCIERLGNPGSWNRYTYAANDPVNGFDPSGLDEFAPGDYMDTSGDGGDDGGGDLLPEKTLPKQDTI